METLEEQAKGFEDKAAQHQVVKLLLKRAEQAAPSKAKLENRRNEDGGRDLPWQAQGENAAAQSTAKDLAEALYNIVAKHAEPEDVLYAMMQLHRKDGSNAFKAALQAFGVTWERKTKAPEKVPA